MLYFIFYTVLAFRRKSSARPSGKKVTCRTVAGPEEDVRRVAPAAETQPRKRLRMRTTRTRTRTMSRRSRRVQQDLRISVTKQLDVHDAGLVADGRERTGVFPTSWFSCWTSDAGLMRFWPQERRRAYVSRVRLPREPLISYIIADLLVTTRIPTGLKVEGSASSQSHLRPTPSTWRRTLRSLCLSSCPRWCARSTET